jgi:hypothetical protein
VSSSEDYLAQIIPEPNNFGYRQGVVISWDVDTGTNQVRVAGSDLTNLPVITQSDLINIRPGDTVAIIKYNDSYAVLGKITNLNPGTPWAAVPLYPLFHSLGAAGTTGYWTVNVGTLASWEGRIYSTHYSAIEVDGIWGQASGTNTVTYALRLGGTEVGTWTTVSTLDVGRKGPFTILPFKDQQFLKAEVAITSSTGTGTVAMQVLGCYLR